MSRIQDGRDKSRKLSRAYEASAKRGESLVEAEKRRKEEAERKRREDEEREAAAQPIRALIREGDDIVGEVRKLILNTDLATFPFLYFNNFKFFLDGALIVYPFLDRTDLLHDRDKTAERC